MDMNAQRWERTCEYVRDVFGNEDEHLSGLMAEAVDAGLPDIAVTSDVGRLLMILTSMTAGRVAIEVGTLAGYSGIWIARGLGRGGKLITIEMEDKHADFAQQQFELAGVAEKVEIRRGTGLDVLANLAEELPAGSVDVIYLDAVKTEYPAYWNLVRDLIAPGGLIMADNVLAGGSWWIGDEGDPNRDAIDQFNRAIAGDRDFEAIAVPLRQGVMIGRRMQ